MFFWVRIFLSHQKGKQGKAILVVDEKGVTDNSSSISFGFIPWGDIDEVRVDAVFGNNCIELLLNNENDYIAKLSGLKNRRSSRIKKWATAVCITLNSTGVDPRALLPGIQKICSRKSKGVKAVLYCAATFKTPVLFAGQ